MLNSLFQGITAVFSTAVIAFNGIFSSDGIEQIDKAVRSNELSAFAEMLLDTEKTPGMSGVVTNGSDAVYCNFGNTPDSPADEFTLYDTGYGTMAFTALSVLISEDIGLVDLDADISEYIPGFTVKYDDAQTKLTLRHLLHHQSGIPAKFVSMATVGYEHDKIKEIIDLTNNCDLKFVPGTDFEFSNIGYDILIYVIEEVSGQSYADFVTENILQPLGMENSGFYVKPTQGYKVCLGEAKPYDAPFIADGLSSGSLITCTSDMEKWLNAQLGCGDVPDKLAELIERSHEIEPTDICVEDDDGSYYYTYGWYVSSDGSRIYHDGTAINFSSAIIIDMENELAVNVLANSSSRASYYTSEAILSLLNDRSMPEINGSCYTVAADKGCTTIFIVELLLLIVNFVIFAFQKPFLTAKKRSPLLEIILLLVRLIICGLILSLLAGLPKLTGISYADIGIWLPQTFTYCIYSCAAVFIFRIIISVRRLAIVLKHYRIETDNENEYM